MNSAIASQPLAQVETPLLAVAVAAGSTLPPSLAALDKAAGGVLSRAAADFKGKRDDVVLVYPAGGKAERLLLVGMGKAQEVTRSAIRRAAGVAAKRARAVGAARFAFAVAADARNGVSPKDLGQVVVEGAAQGAWTFTELKQKPEDPKPEVDAVQIVVETNESAEAEAGRKIGDAVAAGHALT